MTRCTRCGQCWRICPQETIEFQHLLEGDWGEIASMDLVRCAVCGEPLYTMDFSDTLTEKLKPMEEIAASISEFKKVLILGCGSCVTVCLSGGDRTAIDIAREIVHPKFFKNTSPIFETNNILRQCEKDMITTYLEIPPQTEAILSLACGAGVQILAGTFQDLPIIPGLNTTFLGALDEPGIWREKCYGCGDCVLAHTGGICRWYGVPNAS